jgi:hypothetical protein
VILALGLKSAYCQPDYYSEYIQVPYDSVVFDDYKAISYGYQDSAGHQMSMRVVLRIFKNQKEWMIFKDDCINAITSFCSYLSYLKNNCYLSDINKDGHREFLITHATCGASDGQMGGYLYSVNDSANLVLNIPPSIADFKIEDLEHDSIPEIIAHDDLFTFFMDYPYRKFSQPLIWKWDGEKYRIANGRYADYILDPLGPNQLPPKSDWFKSYPFPVTARSSIKVPYDSFWDMVFSYYMVGRSTEADSLFNTLWPPEVPDKEKYQREIKKRIEQDPYWPQILQSNR